MEKVTLQGKGKGTDVTYVSAVREGMSLLSAPLYRPARQALAGRGRTQRGTGLFPLGKNPQRPSLSVVTAKGRTPKLNPEHGKDAGWKDPNSEFERARARTLPEWMARFRGPRPVEVFLPQERSVATQRK